MSVKVADRQISKAEFVNTAYNLCVLTYQYVNSLSKEGKKFYGTFIQQQIGQFYKNVIVINEIFAQQADLVTLYLRKDYIYSALSNCKSLDSWLSISYDSAIQNNRANSKSTHLPKDSVCIKMSELIQSEYNLLKGVKRITDSYINKIKQKEDIDEEQSEYIYNSLLKQAISFKHRILEEENVFYDVESRHYFE